MIRIQTPIPEKVSANAIYAGMHWAKRKKLADLYHSYFIQYRNIKVTEYPVEMSFIFTFKGALLDVSNCSYMIKMIEDALVLNGILQGDTLEFVQSITTIVKKGKKDEVEILIV